MQITTTICDICGSKIHSEEHVNKFCVDLGEKSNGIEHHEVCSDCTRKFVIAIKETYEGIKAEQQEKELGTKETKKKWWKVFS